MTLTAAIVTVGTELTQGLRIDTNTAEIARAITPLGFHVHEAISIGDDPHAVAGELRRLVACRDLVITTGGLGPTHDDITRMAASDALGLELVEDQRLVERLRHIQNRHTDPAAIAQVLTQAQVLPDAEVIDFTTGTAPGLVVRTQGGATLALLPGPPSEMRPMLRHLLERYRRTLSDPRQLGVVGLSESDAQVRVERAIADVAGVGFTILAGHGDVRVILSDAGGGVSNLDRAAGLALGALGDHCYATDESSLARVVVREATRLGRTMAVAESCTGGLIAAALTDVAGASQVFSGGVVCYSNEAKVKVLAVPRELLERHGAVSAESAEMMAIGAYEAFGRPDIVLSVTGVAGPDGGTADKPVGTVWFGVLSGHLAAADVAAPRTPRSIRFRRDLAGSSRQGVRQRATTTALDCLRRVLLDLDIPTG